MSRLGLTRTTALTLSGALAVAAAHTEQASDSARLIEFSIEQVHYKVPRDLIARMDDWSGGEQRQVELVATVAGVKQAFSLRIARALAEDREFDPAQYQYSASYDLYGFAYYETGPATARVVTLVKRRIDGYLLVRCQQLLGGDGRPLANQDQALCTRRARLQNSNELEYTFPRSELPTAASRDDAIQQLVQSFEAAAHEAATPRATAWWSLTHGSWGLLFGYLLQLTAVAAGTKVAQRTFGPVGRLLVISFVTLLVASAMSVIIPTSVRPYVFTPFMLVIGFGAGALVARKSGSVTHHRGAVIVNALTRKGNSNDAQCLTFASLPLPPLDETKHFKVLGTTGTGKSTMIRTLLAGALERGDRAVIADPDGSYLKHLYNESRGDVILNPFDARSARWDLMAEISQPHDADELARALIPDYEGDDRNWRNYARTFVTAVLRQLHRVNERDLNRLYWLLVMAPVEELRDLLGPTPAGPFLGEDNSKFFASVRSVAANHIAALEHIARQAGREDSPSFLSVREWVKAGRGVLFLPYRATEIASLRHVISTWMRLAVLETMNREEGDQHLWFAVDELDALGAIDGFKDALARLRKFGGRCVIGFQSIAQVRGTYGDAEAQTIVENCGNTLILRCSASERGGTSEFASRLIGRREIIRRQTSRSRPSGDFTSWRAVNTVTEQHLTEDAVMASEIEQLPDHAGFVKLASRPEWRRVRLG